MTNRIRLIIALLIAVILALVPLVYSSSVYLVFDLPKLVLLQAGVEIALGLFVFVLLAEWLQNKPWQKPWRALIPQRIDLLWVTLAFFVLSNVLAALLAASPHQAWWGTYYRRQGLFLLLHDVALMSVALNLARDKKLLKIMLGGVLASALGVVFYVILEILNIPDYSHWKSAGAYAGRLVSTFGQPDFMAGYLGMIVPLMAGIIWKGKSWINLVILPALILTLYSIFGSQSRGAWFSLLAVILIAGMGIALTRRQLWQKTTLLLTIVVLTLGGLLGFYEMSKRNGTAFRVEELLSPARWQMIERYQIWDRAIALVANRPWWGYGQDNFELVFPSILRASDQHLQTVYVDRAHNLLLDMLVSSGAWGTLAWLLVVGMVMATTIKTWRRKLLSDQNKMLVVALGLGILFYIFQGMVNLNAIGLDALFWVMLALLVGICHAPDAMFNTTPIVAATPTKHIGKKSSKLVRPQPQKTLPPWAFALLALLIAVPAGAGLILNLHLYQADAAYKNGLRDELSDKAAAVADYQQAIALHAEQPLYRIKLVDNALQLGYNATTAADKQLWYQAAYQSLQAGLAAGTAQADFDYRLGETYQFGQTLVAADWQAKANQYLQQASDCHQEIY